MMNVATLALAPSVMLVGEALVDEFRERRVAGGAPFNVARSLAALRPGLPVCLVTRLHPADEGGAALIASSRRFNLSLTGIQHEPVHATGRVAVLEEGGGHHFEIHAPSAWDFIELAPAQALLVAAPPAFFYFGSLAQRGAVSRASIRALAQQAGELGSTRYLDLNLRDGSSEPTLAAESLALSDWLKVNEHELAQLFAWFGTADDAQADMLGDASALAAPVQRLMQGFSLQGLILTRGAAGYVAFDAQGRVLAQGAGLVVSPMVDTVGAGDAFSAMLLSAKLAGFELAQALALANRYAAALCSERGPLPDADAFFAPWRALLLKESSQ
jgi:fructokinase